jgi:hypothetical protein
VEPESSPVFPRIPHMGVQQRVALPDRTFPASLSRLWAFLHGQRASQSFTNRGVYPAWLQTHPDELPYGISSFFKMAATDSVPKVHTLQVR